LKEYIVSKYVKVKINKTDKITKKNPKDESKSQICHTVWTPKSNSG